MLNKEEKKERKARFYKELEGRMKKTPAAVGRKINWFTYPLNLKETFFRMEFDANGARICIDLQHKEQDIRQLFWDQWLELKAVLESTFGALLQFEEQRVNEFEIEQSRISIEKENLNFYEIDDLPLALDFFEENLQKWDAFWQDFNNAFDALR